MTALFVPALRIMGEHFPECAELSQHHSSAALEKKKDIQLAAGLHLPGRPACSALQMQSIVPVTKTAVTQLQHCGF